jgi:hypothetical protein
MLFLKRINNFGMEEETEFWVWAFICFQMVGWRWDQWWCVAKDWEQSLHAKILEKMNSLKTQDVLNMQAHDIRSEKSACFRRVFLPENS